MDESIYEEAQRLTDATVNAQVKEIQSRLPKQPEGFNGLCVDCDEPIHPTRLKGGAVTCVHCQILREKKM